MVLQTAPPFQPQTKRTGTLETALHLSPVCARALVVLAVLTAALLIPSVLRERVWPPACLSLPFPCHRHAAARTPSEQAEK